MTAPQPAARRPSADDRAADADEDVTSDPAHDDRLGSDWVDEGGATADGPATADRSPEANEPAAD
ncbi:hypothetical protein J4H92_10650 [Leucobacter weissii]|uniref:Uncharacterized protein n=1 Tax=Leucobacter weissii TaxID=1983706 RepID=A0A939MPU8_9MICO|nr:hypothetical protein [Leucobacter weissii]MBO1902406.1 hypothetical protein [Leucobacter weissii]